MQVEALRKNKDKYKATDKFRIVNVSYLNSAPYRVLRDTTESIYTEAPPAECARMLHERECELGLIPTAEFFNHGGYEFLPYGIATQGPVKSVLFASDTPLANIKKVILDKTSQTSIILLKILLNELHPQYGSITFFRGNTSPDFLNLEEGTGALIIGDKAFLAEKKFRYLYDLGEEWTKLTGFPFVFALWATRTLDEKRKKELLSLLSRSVSERVQTGEVFAKENNIAQEIVKNYLEENIVFELGKREQEGAFLFHKKASALGLLPHFDLDTKNNNRQRKKYADEVLNDTVHGSRLSISDALLLAYEASLSDLSIASDLVRKKLTADNGVSYIVDRNINYTNVCNVYCRFCAFYRAPGKEGGYVLSKEEIGKKIEEILPHGGIQILLQGGLHPDLKIDYYEDLFSWLKAQYSINLHALSADEILNIAKVSELSIEETLRRLIAAGLGSLPGAGSEILVDKVRWRIARLKSPSADWLNVHRTAHKLGITSTCTMMFGVEETWEDRLNHLNKLRELQDETGGFTAFITWPFQDENTNLKRGVTSSPEYLRVQAISRLFLDNIKGIQSSWVTMGPALGQVALYYGANDFGSVMFEENVVSSAGTTFCMDGPMIERHIHEAGFEPWQRDVHYRRVN